MKLFADLKITAATLAHYNCQWAICGGIAACVYRTTPRYTADIDIAIIDSDTHKAKDVAGIVAKELKLSPIAGFVTDQFGKLLNGQALVMGRHDVKGGYVGIDFLLPLIPWVTSAVKNAQNNLIDYGFAKLPTLTPEDLIIAKLFALQGTPERKFDLDDIEDTLRSSIKLDLDYLNKTLTSYKLIVPPSIEASIRKT